MKSLSSYIQEKLIIKKNKNKNNNKYKTYKCSKNTIEVEQQIQAEKNSINELLDSI